MYGMTGRCFCMAHPAVLDLYIVHRIMAHPALDIRTAIKIRIDMRKTIPVRYRLICECFAQSAWIMTAIAFRYPDYRFLLNGITA